jgi:DNA-directed RNA polymerase subunit alpha
VEIILNLKQLAVRVFSEEPVLLTLSKKGPGPVTAGDIAKDARVEIANKDLVIANLTSNKTLEMEIVVANGRGYRPVEEKDRKNYDLGTIVVDSVYSPVKDVGYKVEYTRVGDITDYEKLVINIETNGTVSPEEAVNQATRILMDHFAVIAESVAHSVRPVPVITEETVVEPETKTKKEVSEEKVSKKKATKKK